MTHWRCRSSTILDGKWMDDSKASTRQPCGQRSRNSNMTISFSKLIHRPIGALMGSTGRRIRLGSCLSLDQLTFPSRLVREVVSWKVCEGSIQTKSPTWTTCSPAGPAEPPRSVTLEGARLGSRTPPRLYFSMQAMLRAAIALTPGWISQ